MQTKFIHLRHIKARGGLQARGGLTIAFRELPLTDEYKSISLAIARCSREDVFNKKIGRAIAEGRLNIMRNGARSITIRVPQNVKTVDALVEAFGKKDLRLI